MARRGDRQAVFVRIPLNPRRESKDVHVVYSRGYGKLATTVVIRKVESVSVYGPSPFSTSPARPWNESVHVSIKESVSADLMREGGVKSRTESPRAASVGLSLL